MENKENKVKVYTFTNENGEENKHVSAHSRLQAFRSEEGYAKLSLYCEVVHFDTDSVLIRGIVSDGKKVLADGFCFRSRLGKDDSFVSVAETIAKSRALATFGILIDDAEIASAEEIKALPTGGSKKAQAAITEIEKVLR